MSNHEGKYLGDTSLTPFFEYLNARGHEQEVVFVHPTNPVEKINGAFVSANPSRCLLVILCCMPEPLTKTLSQRVACFPPRNTNPTLTKKKTAT